VLAEKSIGRHWATVAFVLVCIGAIGTAAYLMGLNPKPLNDELYDLARPAALYIQGNISPEVKYPSFSFYFFGLFIKLSGTLDDLPAAVQVCRWVNLGIFAANLVLFFAFARALFSKAWALLATFVFLGFPWLWVSAISVKTESLQLFAVLLTLLAVSRINRGGDLRWHALAALGAALAISTKLTGFPLVLYLVNLPWARRRNLLANRIGAIAVTFTAVFVVALLATFTNLWIFPEILRQNATNPYLSSGPAPLTAVSEWSSIWYGRVGTFVIMSLPLLAGFYGVLWLGSLRRTQDSWLGSVFGVATGVSLAVALLATRHRVPYAFAGYGLFLFVASAQFIRDAAVGGLLRRRWANHAVTAALLAVVAFQVVFSVTWAPRWMGGIARANEVSRQINKYDTFYAFQEGQDVQGDVGAFWDTRHPRYIFILYPYAENFCKYRGNVEYAVNCRAFRRLFGGQTAYRVAERIPLPLPFTFLSPDPEVRDPAVYLFEWDPTKI
jgi:4-amino-4-deoxy-L-arabinose transferase-like glycosyltransferase